MAGQFVPGQAAEASYDARPRYGQFGLKMLPALDNFIRPGIAITPSGISRITPDEIGDEDALQARALNHSA